MSTVTAWDLLIESERILHRIQAARKQRPNWETRAEARLAQQLGNLFVDVADDAILELTRMGRVPADMQSRMRLANILRGQESAFADILSDGALDAAQHGRNRIISELQRQGTSIQMTEFSEQIRNQIRNHVFEASERTLQRLTGNVMDNLARSYEDGLGIDDAARELRDVFDGLQDFEAKRIARTEIQSQQNIGAHETIQELGVQYEMWVTADDDRVRGNDPRDQGDHVRLHGQITRTGDAFENGLLHPGDFGPGILEEAINCRCRLVPVIPPRGAIPPPGRQWWTADEWVQAQS